MSHITQGFRIDNKHNKYYCENTKRNKMWHLTLSTLVKFINIEEETLFTLQGSKKWNKSSQKQRNLRDKRT